MQYDWTRFEVVFYYDAPVADVFRAWATAGGLESFFIANASFRDPVGAERSPSDVVQPGDTYRWEWRQPLTVDGKVLDAVENRRVEYTFGEMMFSVSLAPFREQTELRLVQWNIPATDDGRVGGHLNCRSCWVFFLTNLKSVLERGHDLRDERPDRASSMEVGFLPLSSTSPAPPD